MFMGAPGKAQTGEALSGNELLSQCESDNPLIRHKCLIWVGGLASGIEISGNVEGGRRFVCFPERSTYGQWRDIVVKYLHEQPAQRHMSAAALGFVALANAYRCPAKPR